MLALVGSDGIPIEAVSFDDRFDIEGLAAELVALTRAVEENHREFEVGGVRAFAVETTHYRLVLSQVTPDVYLLLVAGERVPLGKLRFELRRSALLLADDLA